MVAVLAAAVFGAAGTVLLVAALIALAAAALLGLLLGHVCLLVVNGTGTSPDDENGKRGGKADIAISQPLRFATAAVRACTAAAWRGGGAEVLILRLDQRAGVRPGWAMSFRPTGRLTPG
jgi:hypothetical protein